MTTEFLDLIHNVVEAQRELSAPFDWQIQLASIAAAGAALLPDISFRESAAQTLERAITTRATVLTSLRKTGKCALILSRTLDIGKVQSEHSHGAWFVKTTSMELSNQQEHCRAVIGTRPYKKSSERYTTMPRSLRERRCVTHWKVRGGLLF